MGLTRTKRLHSVTASDAAVVAVGASAATVSWWGTLVEWLPHMAQGFIVVCTMVFVAVRAIREVRKFLNDRRERNQEE